MPFETFFAAEIRMPDHSIQVLTYSNSMEGDVITHRYQLSNAGVEVGELVWVDDPAIDGNHAFQTTTDTMPDWFKEPSLPARDKLIAAYKPENGPIEATNNVTTFNMRRGNGAMMGQLRSFVSPQGKPIGNPGMASMHGGLVERKDFPDTRWPPTRRSEIACSNATMREISEEFGVKVDFDELAYLGTVYDADNRRHNYVHDVLISYEDALVRTYMATVPLHPAGATRKPVEDALRGAISAILDCEGLGRMTNMFKPDLDRAIELGAITPISIAILKAFPQLTPPEKPLG